MKTAIQKTDELLEQLLGCDLRSEIGIDKAKKLIRLALKEQDRDTRHACAEAVNRIALDHKVISFAHNTIMNTRDV